MGNSKAAILICLMALLSGGVISAQSRKENPPMPGLVRPQTDWPDFLKRQDMTWDKLPQQWYDAPFLGNGMLGTLIRQTGESEVRWDVGHSYVHDHRGPDDYRLRAPEILNRGRVPIGCFLLRTQGKITGGRMRLDLWNAEASGVIETDKGRIQFRTIVHAVDMVYWAGLEADAGEQGCRFEFVPERAESTRYISLERTLPAWYKENRPPNPKPVLRELGDGMAVCEQKMAAGGQTTTAWQLTRDGAKQNLLVTVEHTFPETDATVKALQTLGQAAKRDRGAWIEAHRKWWHEYYPLSFLSIPDPAWECFYWIQMYKLAAATRADRALIDNQGPWLQPTGWNGTWWNLNVQLSYSPVPVSNRLPLGEALNRHLRRNMQSMIDGVEPEYRGDSAALTRNTSMLDLAGRAGKPGGWEFPNPDIGSETGNLAWTCHNVYMQYRCSMDEELLRDLLYPLLKRSINYYRHFLKEGPDGKLHLPPTHSPEYGEAPDCNFDLSLIRWGCATLIELAQRQNVDKEMIPVWRGILEKLTPFPENQNGFMVGQGVGFDKSHRHFSHLLMIYPLRVVNPDNGGEAVIRKSLERWQSLKGALAGYSFTGGAGMWALLGDGNKALETLNAFKPYLQASTMYKEGGALPVMETPLQGASVLQEMLLQSWGGTIRVFPATPDAWKEAAFHQLRAEGAFLVSARRENGKTQWAHVTSLAGEPCRVNSNWAGKVKAVSTGKTPSQNNVALRQGEDGVCEIGLAKGQSVLLYTADKAPDPVVKPVSAADGRCNVFGLKAARKEK